LFLSGWDNYQAGTNEKQRAKLGGTTNFAPLLADKQEDRKSNASSFLDVLETLLKKER